MTQSTFLVTGQLMVKAIDDYIERFVSTDRSGRFWRKTNASGTMGKQAVGIHTLALYPREIASYLGIGHSETYTGHC